MARRSRGDGSVFFDAARGCWVGTVDIGRDPETGRRRRRKVSAASKTGCREKLDALREEKRRTGTVGRRDLTVETVIRDLLANPPAEWRAESTFQVNTDTCERIIAAIGKIRLAKLAPGDVERFLAGMAREGLSTRTIGLAKGLLARAIRRAERDGLVGRNAAALAETPRGTLKKSDSMTLDQVRALFASGLTPWWRAYLMTGILCGLRPGELAGLTWNEVDFAAGVLRVRHSLKEVTAPAGSPLKTVLRLEALKTERSKRTLQLPVRVAEALRALRAAQAADRLRLGPYYGDMNLVFCSAAGQPLRRQEINRRFKQVCKKAGIGAGWHPHEQRHTFVSVLSDAGVDIELIADAAGHVNSGVTRTVYRHQIADKVAKAAAAMDDVFGTGGA
ncbi:site-specific integrase [Trebonia sp.]|uniref:tyrosine-type recombinase/integrase n=1 Tax=Trebonia sp. TaxID=2767075 RepID=UPI002612CBD7|nr:site-specific integrase [Trebonia sp.]